MLNFYSLPHANSLFLNNCMLTGSLFHTKGRYTFCNSLFQSDPTLQAKSIKWINKTQKSSIRPCKGKEFLILFTQHYVYSSFAFRPNGTQSSKMFRLHWNNLCFIHIAIKIYILVYTVNLVYINRLYLVVKSLTSHKVSHI